MKTWTTLNALAVSTTGSTNTTEQTLISQDLNDSIRTIATIRNGRWKWLETTENVSTQAGISTYEIPNGLRKVTNILVQVGGGSTPVYYTPTPIFDQDKWNLIIASRLGTSDVSLFTYIQNTQFLVAPTPATTGNIFILRGRVNVRDLSQADYSTGTITTTTNGGTAVVGSGTTWTSAMAGQWIRITDGSATNLGDGYWYKIASVTDGTHLMLVKPYEGTSIAAGTASYIIGEMSPIPESYDMAPVYRAVALYWTRKENLALAKSYWMMYDGGKEANLVPASAAVGGIIGQMLEEAGETFEGAYISPNRTQMVDPNYPPQNLTGF